MSETEDRVTAALRRLTQPLVGARLVWAAFGPECVKTASNIVGAKRRLSFLAICCLQGHGLPKTNHEQAVRLQTRLIAPDTGNNMAFSGRHCLHQTLGT